PKTYDGVRSKSAAPRTPPANDGRSSVRIQPRLFASSRRKPTAAPNEAGQRPIVLVTFATIGSRPIQSSAGKETNVPPPATALIIPARNAARRMTRESRDTRATLSHARGSAMQARRLAPERLREISGRANGV